jgi:hypothetical protein
MTSTGSASIPAERFVALVGLLNREARLLERLVFKLTETELLTAAGESRFMGLILDEVDDVTADLGGIEVARAMLVGDLCDALGLGDEVPLKELIPYAPGDTATLLAELRERLINAANDLAVVAESGSTTTREQIDQVAGTLATIEPGAQPSSHYDEFGRRSAVVPVPTTFDQPA